MRPRWRLPTAWARPVNVGSPPPDAEPPPAVAGGRPPPATDEVVRSVLDPAMPGDVARPTLPVIVACGAESPMRREMSWTCPASLLFSRARSSFCFVTWSSRSSIFRSRSSSASAAGAVGPGPGAGDGTGGRFGAPASCAEAVGSQAASTLSAASAHARRTVLRGSVRIFRLVFKEWPGFSVGRSDRTANERESLAGATGVGAGETLPGRAPRYPLSECQAKRICRFFRSGRDFRFEPSDRAAPSGATTDPGQSPGGRVGTEQVAIMRSERQPRAHQ